MPGQEPTGTTHGSPWSYDTRVPLQAGAAKVFYYPRAGSSTNGDPGENTVMTILNNTDCFGNTTVILGQLP